MTQQAEELVHLLAQRHQTIGTCESLTAGMVCAAITDVPGASAVFRGGLVTYASDLKHSLAGVDAGWIAQHGVINAETARQMATGARAALGTDWAVACTGVAGPSSQDGADPGTVWIAVAGPEAVVVRGLNLLGDRSEVRRASVANCIDFVSAVCVDSPSGTREPPSGADLGRMARNFHP